MSKKQTDDTKRQPWLKFYTADWRADPGLRMCSIGARGIWIDMLSIMHEADPYGHLLVAGMPPNPADLAQLLGGGTAEEFAVHIADLERRNVAKVAPQETASKDDFLMLLSKPSANTITDILISLKFLTYNTFASFFNKLNN